MLNKKLFIIIGIFVVLLFGYFIFKTNRKEIFPEVLIVEENKSEIDQENIEEVRLLFLEVEKGFYNILENIFLRGEDVTMLLSEEIIEIESNLKRVKEGLEEENISISELNESLSVVQIKMQLLVQKLIELDS